MAATLATPPRSTDSSTCHFSIQESQENTTAESLLCHYSKTFIHLLNARCYNDPFFRCRVRANVYVDLAGHKTTGLQGFVENHRRDAQGSPAFHVDADWNVTALVDEHAGTGTVLLSQHLSGMGGSLTGQARAGTILFAWQRSKGQWWCGNVAMIFGTPEFLL